MKNIYTIILLLFISLFNNGFSQPQTVTFTYTGAAQTWTVPPCVYNISVSVKGAQGGGPGGLGATVLNPTIVTYFTLMINLIITFINKFHLKIIIR